MLIDNYVDLFLISEIEQCSFADGNGCFQISLNPGDCEKAIVNSGVGMACI